MSVLLSVGFGFILAIVVSYYLKKQLHDLEPREIARLLEERNAMLEETKDAILVIDTDQNILLANIEATKMYHNITNSEENLLGKKLSALVLSPEKLVVHSKTEQFIVKMARIISSQSPRLMSVKKQLGMLSF